MSVNEIQALAQSSLDAFDGRDIKTDARHAFGRRRRCLSTAFPIVIRRQASFCQVSQRGFRGHRLNKFFGFQAVASCRVHNDTVGIVNAYDMFRGATKDGKPIAADGRDQP